MNTTPPTLNHTVDPAKIEVGDVMAFLNYVKVKTKSTDGTTLIVSDLENPGKEIRVAGDDLIRKSLSANQFAETVTMSRRKVIRKLISSPNRPITVSFTKKDGSERILRGRLAYSDPWSEQGDEMLDGYTLMVDLEVATGDPIRNVDNRTIEYVITDGVKFLVK